MHGKRHGTPIIVHLFDGKHEVVAFGPPSIKQVFLHSGDFNPDGSGGGEILVAIDALTLAKLLPTIMHALNVANGLSPEQSKEEAPELEPRDE